jgi:hypothetical protein
MLLELPPHAPSGKLSFTECMAGLQPHHALEDCVIQAAVALINAGVVKALRGLLKTSKTYQTQQVMQVSWTEHIRLRVPPIG